MLIDSGPKPALAHVDPRPVDPLRPSEYTAVLIQALRANPALARDAHVLEVGSGSGVVLAALGALGAASLCGIDVVHEAVLMGERLLSALGYGTRAEFLHGDMWAPVAGRRFDLIVANLPHFPTESDAFVGRLPGWSRGGSDGRSLLDRFLDGLTLHLASDGIAMITHNAFVGLDRTHKIVAERGLSLRIALTTMLYIPDEKMRCISDSVLRSEAGRSIHVYGQYAFAEMHIVEIAVPGPRR